MVLKTVLIFCVIVSSVVSKSYISHEKGVDFVNLDEKDTDEMLGQLHEQALSSVMAIIASRNTKYLTPEELQWLEKCSSDATTLRKHAKCVTETMALAKTRQKGKNIRRKPINLEEESKRFLPQKFKNGLKLPEFQEATTVSNPTSRPMRLTSPKVMDRRPTFSQRLEKLNHRKPKLRRLHSKNPKVQQIGSFIVSRQKRDILVPKVKNANEFKLESGDKLSPIGGFAKFFLNGVLELKNKTSPTPWQDLVENIRHTGVERKKSRMRGRQRSERTEVDLLEDLALRTGNKGYSPDEIIEKMIKDPYFKNAQKKEVMKKNPVKKALGLMREGLKLAYAMTGKNITNFDDKTIKVASPRFFSVTPDEDATDPEDTIDVLSPSLLSLHSQGTGLEKEFSVPNLIRGFTTVDQQMWLDLIFEASGVDEAAKQAADAIAAEEFQLTRKKRYQDTMVNEEQKPLYLTKESAVAALGNQTKDNIEHFEKLMKTFTPEQMKKINETGYFVMTPDQMEMVYGNKSVHADPERLKTFSKLNESEIHREIESTVYAIADGRTQRKKRTIFATPFAFTSILFSPEIASQPIILSPIIFTWVVGSPAIFGPIILGPWAFLPLILSPRLMSPAILNPFLFVPIVLSPLALHPAILCPGVFNPLVLSPLLMTPFILSPQVFTPIILSPLCLNPFILTPTVGGPLILSPFVLHP
uniref:Uncharacterized protein n=1 Tax=Panagrellus redivivus TaxID=6233 RepID=A0A7E4WB09_PANRE